MMLEFLNFLRDGQLDALSVAVRLVLSVICGACIGLERERKRRPAGFRTHILICLGAAMTTLTSQFLVLNLGLFTDMARLGAQVIAGIGFIGAGTIIITKRRQVKGLTTAAGLWADAVVGLCLGAGFFEAAIVATVIILLAEIVFARLEYFLISNARSFNIVIEYIEGGYLGRIVDEIKQTGTDILDLELTKTNKEERTCCAVFSLRLPRKITHGELVSKVSKLSCVINVEEL